MVASKPRCNIVLTMPTMRGQNASIAPELVSLASSICLTLSEI
ncbi:hypothetical protein RE6C_04346 [Rhodopirellula europaea 6C]|uniref:Uncharacterized protein n=1 Tax=Rhodopirellula europaea 6C TaxID=1263867 RepID=M2AZB1_9BACT|nr:hypothetical protein RE6C_04346 [Rhodopirellula europaea 6C]